MNKLQAAQQLRRAIQMFAAQLGETQAIEVAWVYPEYRTGAAYQAGDFLRFGEDANGDPRLYKVVQDHTSQEDWTPDATPALYTCVSLTPEGRPLWSPPTGTHDAYNTGDVVSYQGKLYRAKIDGNVWAPDVYPDGWEAVSNLDTGEEER